MFNKDNFLFIIVFLFGLLLPDTNFSYVIIGVAPLLLFINLKKNSNFKVDKYLLVFFFIITLSFIINAFSTYGLEAKQLLRYFSFSILLLLFPFSPKVVIPNWVLYFALIFIVLSQLAFSFGITQIVSLIDIFYPYQGDAKGYNTDFLLSGAGDLDFIVNRRYGGIYKNPNQAVRYVTFLFIVYLIENEKLNLAKKIPFISIVFISIILSGSRTGLLLVLFVLFYSVYIFNNKRINFGKIFSGAIILCGLSFLFIMLSEFNLRIFEISEGGEGSLNAKFVFFDYYLSKLYSPIYFLIGNFSNEHIFEIYGLPQLDSEWGELFYSYGILGFVALFLFYKKLYLLKDSKIRFFMLMLLWGITSTILFSFKMGFLFLLILGKYYTEYIEKRKS